jgi:hypothetical protein
MAIVQISQITNRKGRSGDLPQLAGAELGWSTDTRQLFIGNGTLEEGAPVIGNTELLTEFSNIAILVANANLTVNNLSVTGTITASGNITSNASVIAANVVAGNISGTITTNTQPNITSLGTLTSLSVSGNTSLGSYVIRPGTVATLADNQPTAQPIFTVAPASAKAFVVNYTIIRDIGYQTGSLTVVGGGTTAVQYSDDYVDNGVTGFGIGITLSVSQPTTSDPMSVDYTSTSTGQPAQMTYSITYLA